MKARFQRQSQTPSAEEATRRSRYRKRPLYIDPTGATRISYRIGGLRQNLRGQCRRQSTLRFCLNGATPRQMSSLSSSSWDHDLQWLCCRPTWTCWWRQSGLHSDRRTVMVVPMSQVERRQTKCYLCDKVHLTLPVRSQHEFEKALRVIRCVFRRDSIGVPLGFDHDSDGIRSRIPAIRSGVPEHSIADSDDSISVPEHSIAFG